MRAAAVSAGAGAALLLGALLTPAGLGAQTSLVPAQHPVYDWLHRQRVLGRTDAFPFESRPVSRGTVERHLRQVAGHRAELGRADRALLDAWLQELSVAGLEASAGDNWIRGPGPVHQRIVRLFRENAEPHLFAWADSAARYAVDVFWSQGRLDGSEDGAAFATWVNEKGVRAYADLLDHVGFHLEAGNLAALSDRRGVRLDPLYNKTFEVVTQDKDNSIYYEAFASGAWGPLGLHIGHGALKVGPGRSGSLLLSRDAPVFDWVRLDVSTRHFRYTALHGSLANDDREWIPLVSGPDTIQSRVAPERWLAMHRAEVLPWPSLRVAVTEIVTYSDRGADLAYLNPVSPIFFTELDSSDRDNPVIALDASWRPFGGLELFGALLVDEVQTLGDFFKPGSDGEHAYDLGLEAALPGGWDAEARLVRIDPWTWAHKQRLNAFEQRGFPLAHPLGPNSESLGLRMRRWFPGRASVTVGVEEQKRGLNPVDAQGRIAANVGGDVTVESRDKPEFPRFQGADVQELRRWSVEGSVEPWRGILLEALYRRDRVLRGGRLPELDYLDVRLKIGF